MGVFGVVMVAVLGVQLALIEDQRSTTDAQLRTAVRQAARSIPLMEQVRPLADDARRARPALRRLGKDAGVLLEDLRSADPATALEAIRRLASDVLRSDLPEALDDVTRMTAELRRRDTVAKATEAAELAPRIERQLRKSVRVQEKLLATQIEALRVVQETRDIARDTGRHAESLDRKLGGTTAGP